MASVSTDLFPIVVAECRLLGRGIILWIAGFDHVIVSEESSKSSLKHHFEEQMFGISEESVTVRLLKAGHLEES